MVPIKGNKFIKEVVYIVEIFVFDGVILSSGICVQLAWSHVAGEVDNENQKITDAVYRLSFIIV